MSSADRLIHGRRKISPPADARIAEPADDAAVAASYRQRVSERKEHQDERTNARPPLCRLRHRLRRARPRRRDHRHGGRKDSQPHHLEHPGAGRSRGRETSRRNRLDRRLPRITQRRRLSRVRRLGLRQARRRIARRDRPHGRHRLRRGHDRVARRHGCNRVPGRTRNGRPARDRTRDPERGSLRLPRGS